ncbi:phosphomannomutase [Falsirhodobacter sp. 20TX0035]|uniref:phosphomannomutase n=1 Tax=Falsirhodobacter sp. 20TX0035 TaxID=3022019 RepID=UPI00232FAC60|nr:phosphomannomutase [Falsirhodobacter sp. 20TX0035]MDB6453927.1 phosphomannomutase [Falsirhodobacter sp. 20TX0035]
MTPFGAYDIRGRLGVDLDADFAARLGRAFVRHLGARCLVVGRDNRPSSPALAQAVIGAATAEGAEVLDLGLCGTEEMYHATAHSGAGGGIMVTASHNPADYNGMKLVGPGAAPLANLEPIHALMDVAPSNRDAPVRDVAAKARAAWVRTVLGFVDRNALRPLTILVNAGHGAAGPSFDAVAQGLEGTGLRFLRLHHDPDERFPQGIPNPLLPQNRAVTADAVRAAGADLGVAWDGDFDRCFLFDGTGAFVDGEYVVGLLAEAFLQKEPGATIVHDPRVIWNTQDVVTRAGGRAVASRTGHAFLKRTMRDTGAVYGGEMSAHHYFRDFHHCDSGMIPWLLVAEVMGRTGRSLADLVAARRAAFPSSGEVNFRVADVPAALSRVRAAFDGVEDDLDGLSLDMGNWRFNLRASNTEPLVRLNVESRGDAGLVARQVAAIAAHICPKG